MKKALVVLGLALFCTVVSQNAWASSNIGFKRLGVDVGMVDPEAVSSTIGFGARADLGTISPDIHLSTHVNYWNKSENQFGVEAGLRDISVGARATYNFHMSSGKVQPYVGGGPGVHFFNVKVEVPFTPGMSASESETKIGFDLGGGASMPISPKAQAFSEMYYTVCDIDQFAFKAGVSFALGGSAASVTHSTRSTRGR